MKTTFIYALFDSDGVIDYIGKSNNPKKRFMEHRCRGFVLAPAPFLGWKQYETFFIEQFIELGGTLRNKNRGGAGPTQLTPEACAAISVRKTGIKQSPECVAKRIAKVTGQKRTLVQREYIRVIKFGKKHKKNTSGFVGASWHSVTGKWASSFTVNQKTIHVGLFSKIEDAVFARALAVALQ